MNFIERIGAHFQPDTKTIEKAVTQELEWWYQTDMGLSVGDELGTHLVQVGAQAKRAKERYIDQVNHARSDEESNRLGAQIALLTRLSFFADTVLVPEHLAENHLPKIGLYTDCIDTLLKAINYDDAFFPYVGDQSKEHPLSLGFSKETENFRLRKKIQRPNILTLSQIMNLFGYQLFTPEGNLNSEVITAPISDAVNQPPLGYALKPLRVNFEGVDGSCIGGVLVELFGLKSPPNIESPHSTWGAHLLQPDSFSYSFTFKPLRLEKKGKVSPL